MEYKPKISQLVSRAEIPRSGELYRVLLYRAARECLPEERSAGGTLAVVLVTPTVSFVDHRPLDCSHRQ